MRFHDRPFDEGTLTKLQLFQLYAREWLPVFLSQAESPWNEVHVYDFFAGPGADSQGVPGSPLRLLDAIGDYQSLAGWKTKTVAAHFFDESAENVAELTGRTARYRETTPALRLTVERARFDESLPSARRVLQNRKAAKLVLIDQFGVDYVSDETFRELVASPTCDVLFFISSSTLHRFRDHPAIKQKIVRPRDYHHVHRAVTQYYRELLSPRVRYFLGQFSIKKGSNIYGVIFGSAHPLGIDKFLRVAWQADMINGEADFDINRDDCGPLFSGLLPPTKVTAFEASLEDAIRRGVMVNEADVIGECFRHGVRPQHARGVLKRLKQSGVIDCEFRVPNVDRVKQPRSIVLR